MITIYTIKGCSRCEWIKSLLGADNVRFTDIDADEHDSYVSRLEDLLNTATYPIVHIRKNSIDNYMIGELGEHFSYTPNILIHHYTDIPHLYQLINHTL